MPILQVPPLENGWKRQPKRYLTSRFQACRFRHLFCRFPRGDGLEVNVLKQPPKQPRSPYHCARAVELLSVTGTKGLQAQRKLLSQEKKAACGDRSSEPGACLHCGTWGNAEQLEPEFPI